MGIALSLELIYNPNCSKCIKTLSIIEAHGYKPSLIYYLDIPLTSSFLNNLITKLNIQLLDLLRSNESEYNIDNLSSKNDDELLLYIISNPILIQRPIAIYGDRAIICRPPEKVLDLLKVLK